MSLGIGGVPYPAGTSLSTPVSVPNGGTGAATLTAHGVLVGEGTSAITALAVGTTGTVLAGATGADPSFTATPVLSSVTSPASTTLTLKSAQVDGASPAILLDTTNAVTGANPLLAISNAGTRRVELLVNGNNLYLYFNGTGGALEGGFITNATPTLGMYGFQAFQPYSDGGADLGLVATKWATVFARLFATDVGSPLASATTITPIRGVHHVTGTTTITTITVPASFTGTIALIPDGLWSTNTGGNIAKATTGVVGKTLHMTYDGSLWYPSY